jgi:hypothetical protein
MAGFSNDVVYGSNIDFSGQSNPAATMTLDNQILIGSTALNAGGTHCNIVTLTAGSNIGFSNVAGVFTINNTAPPPAGGVTSAIGTANQVLVNGLTGAGNAQTGAVTFTTPQDIATTSSVTFGNVTMGAGGALRTSTVAGNSLLLQGYDTDTGPAYTTFATITAGTTPTCIFTASNGASAGPAYSFATSTNTGLYLASAGITRMTTAGTDSMSWTNISCTANQGFNVTGLSQFNGGMGWAYIATAISVTATTSQTIIGVTDTSAARTITLPSAPNDKHIFIIKDESGAAATNNITVSGNTKLIDGQATQTISTNYGSMSIYYSGTAYFIF